MKIISLNTFAGHVFEPLMKFVREHAADTDVFCFQEITSTNDPNIKELTPGKIESGPRGNLLQELEAALPNFEPFFANMQDNFDTNSIIEENISFGLATFVRKSIDVKEREEMFLCNSFNSYDGKDFGTLGYNLLSLTLDADGKPLTLVNLHGNSEPGHKRDTPQRLEQSQKIIDFLKDKTGEKIIMGDFNMFPDTEAIRMFEPAGYRNLITDFKIKNTRGSLVRKLFPHYGDSEYGFQEYADFTFVTPGINIESFKVPDIPISDHLPMIMQYSLLNSRQSHQQNLG